MKIFKFNRAEDRISTIGILYFMFGFVFASLYAIYYHWPLIGFLSPGFWAVSFTWPFQAVGFIRDLMYFGIAGKPF